MEMVEHVVVSDYDDRMQLGTPVKTEPTFNTHAIKTEPGVYTETVNKEPGVYNHSPAQKPNRSLFDTSIKQSPGTPEQQQILTKEEQIVISPDPKRTLVEARTASVSSLSSLSLPNVSHFAPMLNSTTIAGHISSPRTGQNLNPGGNNGETAMDVRPSRQPFQSLVEDSPAASNYSSRSHPSFRGSGSRGSGSSYHVDDSVNDSATSQVTEIEDSVIISDDDDEEKENVEPANISVHYIQEILEKSLNRSKNMGHGFISDSPLVGKSRRKSTAFRRPQIESSDEDPDNSNNRSTFEDDNDDDTEAVADSDNDVLLDEENEYHNNQNSSSADLPDISKDERRSKEESFRNISNTGDNVDNHRRLDSERAVTRDSAGDMEHEADDGSVEDEGDEEEELETDEEDMEEEEGNGEWR